MMWRSSLHPALAIVSLSSKLRNFKKKKKKKNLVLLLLFLMEKTGCEIICGAPTTLAVKG